MMFSIADLVKIENLGQTLSKDDDVKLNNYLDVLLDKISECENVVNAKEPLDQLGRFQYSLAIACFKWHVSLSARLMSIVREFDRPDDPELRLNIFNRIKMNKFR